MNATEPLIPQIQFSHEGPHRCGDPVTGTWTLKNWGDSDSVGVRLRFEMPDGLTMDPERTRIPGVDKELLHQAFVQPGSDLLGVYIRDLAPGEAITPTIALKIGKVTSEQKLWVKAVLTWQNGEQMASDPTPINVRLAPRIVVPLPTVYKLMADTQHFGIKLKLVNDGGMPEEGVVVKIPVPETVDVGEPMLAPNAKVEFHNDSRTVILTIDEIRAYDQQEIGLQFRASDKLIGDLVEITDIVVTSPSSGAFHLDPVPAHLERSADFSTSTLQISPSQRVEAGTLVILKLHVHNAGRSSARDVPVSITLPHALLYSHGSLSVNGAHDVRKDDLNSILIPSVLAHATSTVELSAFVRAPIENQARHLVTAMVDNHAVESLEIETISKPEFRAEENYLYVETPLTIEPHAEREVFIKIMNAGTDGSRQARLRIEASEITIKNASVEMDGVTQYAGIIPILGAGGKPSFAIDLGQIGPQDRRLVRLQITAPETFLHGVEFPLTAYLRHDGGDEFKIGGLTFTGRSFPRISFESAVSSQRLEPLRLGQPRNLSIRLRNDGADVATNVKVDLDLPKILMIERVSGAKLNDDDSILFNEIPAQAAAEATVTVRVVATTSGNGSIDIYPVVSGDRMNTVHLTPLSLITTSQSYLEEIRVDAIPIQDDSTLSVTLSIRNIGDGEASNVTVRSTSLEGYAINTTTLDGKTLRDIKGQSPLVSGLTLPPIHPGTVVVIGYTVTPASEHAYTPVFNIESEDQENITAQGAPYRAALKHMFLPVYLEPTNRHLGRVEALNPASREESVIDAEFRVAEPASAAEPVVVPANGHAAASADVEIIVEPAAVAATVVPVESPAVEAPKTEVVDALSSPPEPEAPVPVEPAVGETEKNVILPVTAAADIPDSSGTFAADILDEAAVAIEAATPATVPVAQPTATEGLRDAEAPKPEIARPTLIDEDEDVAISVSPRLSSDQESGEEVVPAAAPIILTVGGKTRIPAPLITFDLTQDKISSIRHNLKMLFDKDEIGSYRHVFAMRLFAADAIYNADPEVEQAWQVIKASFVKDLGMPVMRLLVPAFTPSMQWAEMVGNNEAAITATRVLTSELPSILASNSTMLLPQLESTVLYGSIGNGNFDYFDLEGSANVYELNAIIPELIPTQSEKWPALAMALDEYKRELAAYFKSIVYKGAQQRHEMMIRTPNQEMDDALRNIDNIIESQVA